MLVPFSVADFIDRAVQVYGDRTGVVDEPDQPAPSLGNERGELTYAQVGDLARRQAAHLDSLGIDFGDRVAVVSQNSARLFTSFFGVSGFGRVLVPVNFRLRPDEVSYIVEHSGAKVLYVDPELDDALQDVTAEHRFVLGQDDDLFAPEGSEPKPWEHDENATATINYTSGTTARPKGVQITHRNIWTNAVTFALHAGVTDRSDSRPPARSPAARRPGRPRSAGRTDRSGCCSGACRRRANRGRCPRPRSRPCPGHRG